ncbi:ABC-type nickel/cobalt efflux system, permease component RcnA [Roseivivax lentus]|uniref:Nickel/cobalt efflux system n=1 Tax=Roseivivax lentus TaxID=633194 RepID=A0A1N7L0H9_9RHOB|nr:hypothetical protein [Roseivivax lentus]SIS67297.1 ABC-type nickel/cobalt efflux system, permease component RcnA [Roseivivax lentus]
MRRLVLILPVALAAALVWGLATGQDAALARWAAEMQREFQNALAGNLRAQRSGTAGAFAAFLALCFGYGFFHALGPGHGKVVVGGYGVARQVPVLRLSLIALLSAFAQALSAILIVLAGLFLLNWSRTQMTDTATDMMVPVSGAAIGLVGLWLAFRGARGAWRSWRPQGAAAGHDHAGCGHSHGPSMSDLRRATNLREAAALIVSIGIRPCSGAILLLVLTWYMGNLGAGILGTLAMSAGTAGLTILVAVLSVTARESTALSLGETRMAQVVAPALELLAGAAIIAFGWQMIG